MFTMSSLKKEKKHKSTTSKEDRPLGARRIRVMSTKKLFKPPERKLRRYKFTSDDEETILASGGTVGLS